MEQTVSTQQQIFCFDESLTWKKHLSNYSKIPRAIFSLIQEKHYLPTDTLKILCFSLVHPHLSYGILNLLHLARCNSDLSSNLPLYVLPQIWNKWSVLIPERWSRSQAKSQMKNSFLNTCHSSFKCTYVHCKDC